ncbi:hypothetical protein [Fundidesulfovibrio soli]|uniref:hypothetical protein n=1 Tax=Fundidesulfovibrio soli TaxID=2922716 RepID=UPI001FAF8844|nr:hypothetical protein [Fundidesulfovibrio soli]
MSEDLQARTESVPPINETTVPAHVFQGLVRTLKCMAAISGPVIKIEDKIVSTSFRGGIAIADMTGLNFSTVPMTIYRNEKAFKELDRLVGGTKVRIHYRESDESYYADNGHLELPVGQKCHAVISHPHTQYLDVKGEPITGLKPSLITKHIGNASDIVLGLCEGQIDHICSGVGTPLRLRPAVGGVARQGNADLLLMVRQCLVALKSNPTSFTLHAGKLGEEWFVELKGRLGHKMHLLVREKAVVL